MKKGLLTNRYSLFTTPSRPANPHRLLEGPAHLGRLPVAVAEALQAHLQERVVLELLERDPFGAGLVGDVRQLDAPGHVRVADHAFRLGAACHRIELVEEAL